MIDRLRNLDRRIQLAAIGLMACAILSCCGLVGYQYLNQSESQIQANAAQATATPDLVLTQLVAMEQTRLWNQILTPTSTPPPPPVATSEPCIYSKPWINSVATPIPSGQYSHYEGYYCVQGYWQVNANQDLVNEYGVWGRDGSAENFYIKYNSNGSVADRIWFNPQSTRIPGPNN